MNVPLPSLTDLRVLIVEDNFLIQKSLSVELEDEGCAVTVAANGKEGVEKAQAQPFDIILMDIMMPIMHGDEATRIIRETVSPDLPIIAVTAYSREEMKQRCFALGVSDYMVKPVNMDELKKRIAQWTGRGE